MHAEFCFVDNNAPTFPSGCVQDMHVLAGSRDSPAVVTWKQPKVSDNSGSDITVTYSHKPGSSFPLGRTAVVVNAEDKDHNVMKCIFSVFVEGNSGQDGAIPIKPMYMYCTLYTCTCHYLHVIR